MVNLYIHRFILATEKLRLHKERVKDLSDTNPARSHKEVRSLTGRIMVKSAAQTNMDPNRDKILAPSNHPKTSELYRCHGNVIEYELECLLSGVLPVFIVGITSWRENCRIANLPKSA